MFLLVFSMLIRDGVGRGGGGLTIIPKNTEKLVFVTAVPVLILFDFSKNCCKIPNEKRKK